MEQVRALEPAAREKAKLESQLAAAEKARTEAEDRLRRAVRESEAIQHEVRVCHVEGEGGGSSFRTQEFLFLVEAKYKNMQGWLAGL